MVGPPHACFSIGEVRRHNHLEPFAEAAAGQRHLVTADNLPAALYKRPERRSPLSARIEDGPVLQAALVFDGQPVAVDDGARAAPLAHRLDEGQEEAGGELLPGGRVQLHQLDVEVGGHAHRQVGQHRLVRVPNGTS